MEDVKYLLKNRGTVSDSELLDQITRLMIPIGEVKPLEDYPGYAVTSEGQVISLGGTRTTKSGRVFHVKERVLTQTPIKSGNPVAMVDGKTVRVARLVAKAFVPNHSDYFFVSHINGNQMDNRACNLRWSKRSAE
ncbi:hypothetical protein phiJL1_ORF134 [Lactobacillus phage phiJL-1]|uniref:HNH endonuclease n=1 Tax=Lactobacillus phage phiJL-1 TaxID=2892345 RepID=Q597T6_9CAUD|nr:hypothetical protein phiJL1_ORF134 [Lactobacillus phage phiJL-1]AAP74535.1 putative protein [Lactobacillus phage phiJL-1]